MGTTITFRRGENDPTSGSGLTLAEPAFNTTLHTFHIGLGYGVTAAWVGAPITGLSGDIAAGITYKIPSAAAVKNYIGGLCFGNTGAITITQYVSSFNGLTGAVGGVCAAQANTFTALQSFASGISASGITVNGSMTVTGNFTVSGGVTFTTSENVLIEDNIITLNSNVTGSPTENAGIEIERGASANVQLLWNETGDKWTFTNDGSTYYDLPTSVVTSFNGSIGAVQGVSSLNGFTGSISISGGTGISLESSSNSITVNATVLPTNTLAVGRKHLLMGGTTSGNTALLADNNLVYSPNTRFLGAKTSLSISGLDQNYGQVNTIVLNGITTAGIDFYATNNTTTLKVAPEGDFTKLAFETGNEENLIETFTGTITFADYLTDVRTYYLPNASGTIALTSQLMGAVNGSTAATTAVTSFNGLTGAVQGVSATVAGTGISVSGATGQVTITNTGVQSLNGLTGAVGISAGTNITVTQSGNTLTISSSGGASITDYVVSFNGLTGAVTGVTVGGANTFTSLNTFSAGICAAESTFSSTTNTIDVIASTEGAGLRIARATSGVGSRIGGIRFGRSTTSSLNTYIEGSSGTFSLYNGVDNTGTLFAAFSPTQFTLGTSAASFITLNCPNNISFGDTSTVGNGQLLSISGTNRFCTFGDSNGITTGFFGINRIGLCADYALEVNSPTGKGLQLIYNDHTGAASNWVNFDVSSSGDLTISPSGGDVAVSGNLTANNIVNAINGRTGGVTLAAGTGITLNAAGNTITIASTASGGSTNTTTQTLDFSELINQIEVVISGSGGDFGTLLTYIENNTINSVSFDTNTPNNYVGAVQSIKSFYDATNGWSARIVLKPPFTNGSNTTAESILAEIINNVTIDSTTSSGLNVVDFWQIIDSQVLLHKEASYTIKTVTGQTWVAADSFITCKVLGLTTGDHIPEDASLEAVQFEIDNIVAGTGFDIIGYAPEGTYGKYSVKCLGQ